MADEPDIQGPLAEFTALRAEIADRVRTQHQLLSLQLTLSATIFGFAISRPGLTPLLLILPFTSYLLCGRLVAQHFGTVRVARYIREQLSPRVPGGLGWEEWIEADRKPHLLGLALPLLLTFVGADLLALGWTTHFVFLTPSVEADVRAGLVVIWLLGLATVGLSGMLLLQMSRLVKVRSWVQAGLS